MRRTKNIKNIKSHTLKLIKVIENTAKPSFIYTYLQKITKLKFINVT